MREAGVARSHYYFSLPPDMEGSIFAFDLHTEANNVTEGIFCKVLVAI